MVGTPRDMTLIIAGFFTQNLPAKAVELMSNGFLLGWCQLQELFTSSHAPRGRLSSPFAAIPNGRCGFGKVFGNIFEIFQKYLPEKYLQIVFISIHLPKVTSNHTSYYINGFYTIISGMVVLSTNQVAEIERNFYV